MEGECDVHTVICTNGIYVFYAMVGGIPHAIVYGMHYVVCMSIPYSHMTISHDHLVSLLTIWYAFLKINGWNSYATLLLLEHCF